MKRFVEFLIARKPCGGMAVMIPQEFQYAVSNGEDLSLVEIFSSTKDEVRFLRRYPFLYPVFHLAHQFGLGSGRSLRKGRKP